MHFFRVLFILPKSMRDAVDVDMLVTRFRFGVGNYWIAVAGGMVSG